MQRNNELISVAVIILNWNNAEDTLACLGSVAALDYPAAHVIVVDNGSTDDSAARIRASYSDVELIETGENLGYAGGNNVGIRYALAQGAEYVCILNNDVSLAPDTLTKLALAAEQNPEAAFFGPKVLHKDRPTQIQSAGARLDWLWRSHQRGLDESDEGQYGALEEVDYVIGAVLLLRAETLNQIGLLDPDYFLYREDVDWCLRARKRGYKILYVPEAYAWHRSHHIREQQLPRITYYMTRNSLLLIKKQKGGGVRFIAVFARHLLTAIVWTIKPKWRHKRVERNALLKGLADYLMGKVGKGYA
jgi:GT2 family glycosyltransferase